MTNNKFDTYNLGGKENIQIKSLAEKIIKLSNSQSKIKLVDYKRAYNLSKKYKNNYQDIINRHPSIKKIKKDLKFSPKKSFKSNN
jgi:nucleoside-diphosphate-sugar epimerase